MKISAKVLLLLVTALVVGFPLGSMAASEQEVINACKNNKSYTTWMNRCQNNPTAQAACYCAAAALIRCCMTAAPTHPSVGEWKKAYEQNLEQATQLGTKCFNN